ncbi:Glycosyl phosphatidyl inositol protein transamidase complex subunit [Elasticomyces elasticus]|nr:Glycosyl phosphatidyl inositol protein transamidase complex subunit [Elasticomyces elasticus]
MAVGKGFELVKLGGDVTLITSSALTRKVEHKILVLALVILAVHMLGVIPLYTLINLSFRYLPLALGLTPLFSVAVTILIKALLKRSFPEMEQRQKQMQILQALSLLLLSASLSTLATLNFSLAFIVGILASPLAFVRPAPATFPFLDPWIRDLSPYLRGVVGRVCRSPFAAAYMAMSPPAVLVAICWWLEVGVQVVLEEASLNWGGQGVYTQGVVWGVWWPAWVVAGAVLDSEEEEGVGEGKEARDQGSVSGLRVSREIETSFSEAKV